MAGLPPEANHGTGYKAAFYYSVYN